MIIDIADMIYKEARGRRDQDLDLALMMVLMEVTDKVLDAIKTVKVDNIKSTRLKFRRKKG